MNQTSENSLKTNVVPDLARLTQIWAPKIVFVGFNSTRC